MKRVVMALFSSDPPRAASSMSSAVATAALAAPWVQWLARFGYAARGIVYLTIGALALQAALSARSGPEDSSGALQAILRQPFGRVLLGVLAVGLAGFVLWRLVQAIRDPERQGTDLQGLAKRGAYLISALVYGGLAVEAFRLFRGSGGGGSSGERQADHWTAVVMSQPLGRWIIGAVGATIVLYGLYEAYRAFTTDFTKRLDLSRLGADARRRIVAAGRLGFSARAVVFGIIGWFLARAAFEYDPAEARGFESALLTVQQQGYGRYLLGAVAIGLFAYGLFELAEARYRVIRPRSGSR